MLCVHLGPGRLGLGLVVQQLLEAEFEVCLVGRPGGREEPREFGLTFTDPEVGLLYRSVRWTTDADDVSSLPTEVLRRAKSSDPLLLTSAMKDEIATRERFVHDLVSARPPGAETILLVCENEPDVAYTRLACRHPESVIVLNCVVDRICAWPEAGKRDEHGRRVVQLHPVGEWIVPAPPRPSAAIERLRTASLVDVVAPPLDGYKARKLWAVNGVHIVLGLVARLKDIERLPLAEPHHRAFLDIARPLIEQVAMGVHHRWSDVPLSPKYVEDRVRAFVQSPDTTARLLEDHLIREDLRSFMLRLDRRIGDAARAAHAAGADCRPFADAMSLVVTVLADPALYYPGSGGTPDAAVDDEVIQGFARALDGWMPEAEATGHTAALSRSLVGQRSQNTSAIGGG